MKRSRFSIFLLGLVFCISAGIYGTVFASDTIKIGILGPFSGSLAFNAGEMKKGMMLALDEINAKGGLFGKKVEIVFGDTECKPDKGLAAVKKLVTRDNVLVVGGGYCSSRQYRHQRILPIRGMPGCGGNRYQPHHHQ